MHEHSTFLPEQYFCLDKICTVITIYPITIFNWIGSHENPFLTNVLPHVTNIQLQSLCVLLTSFLALTLLTRKATVVLCVSRVEYLHTFVLVSLFH